MWILLCLGSGAMLSWADQVIIATLLLHRLNILSVSFNHVDDNDLSTLLSFYYFWKWTWNMQCTVTQRSRKAISLIVSMKMCTRIRLQNNYNSADYGIHGIYHFDSYFPPEHHFDCAWHFLLREKECIITGCYATSLQAAEPTFTVHFAMIYSVICSHWNFSLPGIT